MIALFESEDARDITQLLDKAQLIAQQLQQRYPSPPGTAATLLAGVESGDREPSFGSRIGLLQRLVGRITVSAAQLQIVVRLDAISFVGQTVARVDDDASRHENSSSPTTVIALPIRLKRCGLGLRLIANAPGAQDLRQPDPRLIALLTKANDWFAQLIAGDHIGILSIAKREQVSSSYVARVINVAFLAPDIASAIAQGQQPPALTARKLIRNVPLPIGWSDQRARLGFDTQVARLAG